MDFRIRPIRKTDIRSVRKLANLHCDGEFTVTRGVIHYHHKLQGFVAEAGKSAWLGMATYDIQNSSCELITLNSLQEGEGIGTALLEAVVQESLHRGCSGLWCVITNDNFPALTFRQKRGFHIVAVHPGAVERARILKPSLPLWGIESIPLRDEIELEFPLHSVSSQ